MHADTDTDGESDCDGDSQLRHLQLRQAPLRATAIYDRNADSYFYGDGNTDRDGDSNSYTYFDTETFTDAESCTNPQAACHAATAPVTIYEKQTHCSTPHLPGEPREGGFFNLRTRICLALFCSVSTSAYADIITVTNTNDSGSGSLRQALVDANDSDTINFAVTGTIGLTSDELLVNKSHHHLRSGG